MSVLHQQVPQWLGIRPPHTERQMLEVVEQQLPTSSTNRLLDTRAIASGDRLAGDTPANSAASSAQNA